MELFSTWYSEEELVFLLLKEICEETFCRGIPGSRKSSANNQPSSLRATYNIRTFSWNVAQ